MVRVMGNLETDVKALCAGAPFEFAIRLMGPDLQLEGITQNQPITDFNEKDKSVAEILTIITSKGNPDKTVKSTNEPGQKLIWVIGKHPDSGKPCVLITTRVGAEKRKDALPPPFQLK
jgi:hypothetical protein